MQQGGPVAGVDWASELHVACVVDEAGLVVDRFGRSTHDGQGAGGHGGCAGAALVAWATERGDGPVVEVLLAGALAVFVVPSRQIKALRSRYGSAGNKDDRFDAYVLADTLRTDGHRWKPLREDHPDTRALRALCRSRKDLVETKVAMLNQLRANLELAFPAVVIRPVQQARDSLITLAILRRFPQPRRRGCHRGVWPPGCPRSATPAAHHPRSSTLGLPWARPDSTAPRATPVAGSLSRWSPRWRPSTARLVISKRRSASCSRRIQTNTSSRTFPGRGWCERPVCSPRSVTAVSGSRLTTHSPRWPERHRQHVSQANGNRPCSGGRATRSFGPPSWTSRTALSVVKGVVGGLPADQ